MDHIPAEVCTICGDVLPKPETVEHIENILETRSKPNEMVPLFEYE